MSNRGFDTPNSHTIESATCIKETGMAVLVEINDEEHWVPKSVIMSESDIQGLNDEGDLVVADWWAEKSGIE